jgi:hypothetical protein
MKSAVGELAGKFFGLVVGVIASFVFDCEVPAHLEKSGVRVSRFEEGMVELTWEIYFESVLGIWDGERKESCRLNHF